MQTERTLDPAILARWIGRHELHEDVIRLQPATLMELTLDRAPKLAEGDPLPALWHWLYFLTSARMSALGRDGHPALGGFLPPVALPRRMWAGGRFGFAGDVKIGTKAEKGSTVTDVTLKQGRSGALCFVTVRHEVFADGPEPAFWEEHDIVYRDDPVPGAAQPAPPAAPESWSARETVTPSEVMLFRYSALTFNGHRIHYDRDYARDVEGHEGLVVHGPLIATLLADLAERQTGKRLVAFSFRAQSPLYDHAPFHLIAKPDGPSNLDLAAVSDTGTLAMSARAEFAE